MAARKTTKQNVKSPELTVDAMPTKALFIEMLTRDIELIPAIVDLVDNCVDGAIRLRGEGAFTGLWVKVGLSKRELRIDDNCGGIEVDNARKYAFRFGRSADAPAVKHSLGRFGVGMKRAFFKIGKRFRVESTAKRSRFALDVDVDKWARDETTWEFSFETVQEKLRIVPKERRGTMIAVTHLRHDVAEAFDNPNFETSLELTIKSRLSKALSGGLAINLNERPIGAKALEFLYSRELAPAYKRAVYRRLGPPVTMKLYCGVAASDPGQAGWYVFCNGRQVLEADKTDVTGWGKGDEGRVPGFHPQYNRFRGYAFFDSDDAGRLPWITTKTGLDTDSPVYRAARPNMMQLMQPVITFLNKLKVEREGKREGDEKGPLEQLLDSAEPTEIKDVTTRSVFELPRVPKEKRKGPELQRIQYHKPLEQVNEVKTMLRVQSFKQVGEKTFEYFYSAECAE